jgi:O-antigen/teichoic acid export membrane protein
MLPVAMLSGHHRYILVAYNHQDRLLSCTAISALAAVAFGVLLTPHYGAQGTACALLIASILNFALVYASVRRHVMAITVHRQLLAPLLALATAAGVYVLLERWNSQIALLASCIWYLGILLWRDGPQLLTFLRTIPGNSATETVSAA